MMLFGSLLKGDSMIICQYDGLDSAARDRHAHILVMARNVLAKQHGMVADLDPALVRKRAAEVSPTGLDVGVRTF